MAGAWLTILQCGRRLYRDSRAGPTSSILLFGCFWPPTPPASCSEQLPKSGDPGQAALRAFFDEAPPVVCRLYHPKKHLVAGIEQVSHCLMSHPRA